MAAVSALPYVQPRSAQLQKLVVLTWFDSSKQVSSFISSTLKSISELPTGSDEFLSQLSQKAGEALKLAKPIRSGIHKSQNIKIKQFLDTLKASVGMQVQVKQQKIFLGLLLIIYYPVRQLSGLSLPQDHVPQE